MNCKTLLLLLLWGGIAQGIPYTVTMSELLFFPHLSANHSVFIHQSSLAITRRDLVAKQVKLGEK
jgi:hypothetical protein